MATVNKDFKIKSGLVVEGANGTINGYNILTEAQDSVDFIVDTIGGTSTSANTPDTVVKRDANGDFAAGIITADLVGDVTGNVTGTVSDISNHSTTDLSEGTNLYFTDARAVTANQGLWDAAGSASAAQSAAEGYADGVAATAETNAKSYADGLAVNYDPAGSAATAETNANTYTDGEILDLDTSLKLYADQAEADAKTYADGLAVNYDPAGSASTAESNAASYTDTAIANLIDGAPDLLNTLNEIAAAIADDENFSTTVLADIAQGLTDAKAYTDTRETAITTAYQSYADTAEADAVTTANAYTDGEIGTLDTSLKAYADTAEADAVTSANSYTDGRETAITAAYEAYADQAEVDANLYTDGEIATISGVIDNLTTDDVAEGTALYFTDERAQDAVGAMLTGTQTNITVTYDDAAGTLSFVAENGVADSDTDDLAEGSTNLYFTDQRAVDALEAVVPNFTEVDINSVATQVAATQTVATASQVVGYSFSNTAYRSAKFLVKVASGVHTEMSEVLVTLDTSDNIAITEYAIVGTNGTLATITAGMNGTDVELLVTTANNNSDVTVVGTLLV